MFSYHVNCRVLDGQELNSDLRLSPVGVAASERTIGSWTVDTPDSPNESSPVPITACLPQKEVVKYPLFWIPKVKGIVRQYSKRQTKNLSNLNIPAENPSVDPESVDGRRKIDSSFHINVEVDFGKWFTWLERGIWLTMIVSIAWALALDTLKATTEVCTKNGQIHYPFNVLPSLSRTMGSFRIGTLFWTICMAMSFIARLLSNYFLHKLYEVWYDTNLWNTIFLRVAYYLDNVEIISLVMIPAYNLDCDQPAHRAAFISFLTLTFAAEICQYLTRFLRRKKGISLFMEDINHYYTHIGILIILQTFFLLWMLTGFLLHEHICGDFHFTFFTIGEYFTILVNVRFKRDTILFVR